MTQEDLDEARASEAAKRAGFTPLTDIPSKRTCKAIVIAAKLAREEWLPDGYEPPEPIRQFA